MPKKETIEKARRAKRQGKSPSTQAGAFVEEEIEDIREGKHGARSAKQAIAIGLSKARRQASICRHPSEARRRKARAAAPGMLMKQCRASARPVVARASHARSGMS